MTDLRKDAVEIKPEAFTSITSCMVIAPHPDDEALGCGGLIALLRESGKDVFVVFTTDGSLSHPSSKKYPADKLAKLRKDEALQALAELGVSSRHVFFMNKKDGHLPAQGEPQFEQNAHQLHLLIGLLQPDLVLVPYEKDPHRDHRATWQMLMYLRSETEFTYRILEYVIWLHERGKENEMPGKNEIHFLDISRWQTQKQQAIGKHLSQTTRLIDDDPQGFILSPEVLSHFSTHKEYYLDRQL